MIRIMLLSHQSELTVFFDELFNQSIQTNFQKTRRKDDFSVKLIRLFLLKKLITED